MARVYKYLKKIEPIVFVHQKLNNKHHTVIVAMFDPNNIDDMKNIIETNLPVCFHIASMTGNKNIFVILNYIILNK